VRGRDGKRGLEKRGHVFVHVGGAGEDIETSVSPGIWLIRKVQRNAEGLIQGFDLVRWECADKVGQG
jgi:hypothetical protein